MIDVGGKISAIMASHADYPGLIPVLENVSPPVSQMIWPGKSQVTPAVKCSAANWLAAVLYQSGTDEAFICR